ncbi:uncharacterized protein LOC105067091 isoform X2 [Camelus bactrianus]
MKSSVRQLDRCGFGGMRQDRHTAVCLSNVFSEERPGYVLSKLQFYCSPLFKRDCPHLPLRMKRRVGVKPASRQMDGRPAAPGFPPDPTTAEPQDDLPPGPEDNQETLSTRELDSATGPAARDSPPPAPEGTAAHPTKKTRRCGGGGPEGAGWGLDSNTEIWLFLQVLDLVTFSCFSFPFLFELNTSKVSCFNTLWSLGCPAYSACSCGRASLKGVFVLTSIGNGPRRACGRDKSAEIRGGDG